jgi:hypothetical protein
MHPNDTPQAEGFMIKKGSAKTLSLSRETLRQLATDHLADVAAGAWYQTYTCFTCACSGHPLC